MQKLLILFITELINVVFLSHTTMPQIDNALKVWANENCIFTLGLFSSDTILSRIQKPSF